MTDDVTNKKMVVGFLFRGTLPLVLLVQKKTPAWQGGLLNGVGGVMNSDETPLTAMRREFHEETQFPLEIDWRLFAIEREPFGAYYVYFFTANLDQITEYPGHAHVWPPHNDADEMLMWLSARKLHPMTVIGNLSWLIPLALDPGGLSTVTVERRGDIRERPTW